MLNLLFKKINQFEKQKNKNLMAICLFLSCTIKRTDSHSSLCTLYTYKPKIYVPTFGEYNNNYQIQKHKFNS